MVMALYQPIGPSNSTTTPVLIILKDEERLIAIENASMMSGDLFIRGAPGETLRRPRFEKPVRPVVRESLERSLREHAEVWSELAKH
jgi:hypothetical protein